MVLSSKGSPSKSELRLPLWSPLVYLAQLLVHLRDAVAVRWTTSTAGEADSLTFLLPLLADLENFPGDMDFSLNKGYPVDKDFPRNKNIPGYTSAVLRQADKTVVVNQKAGLLQVQSKEGGGGIPASIPQLGDSEFSPEETTDSLQLHSGVVSLNQNPVVYHNAAYVPQSENVGSVPLFSDLEDFPGPDETSETENESESKGGSDGGSESGRESGSESDRDSDRESGEESDSRRDSGSGSERERESGDEEEQFIIKSLSYEPVYHRATHRPRLERGSSVFADVEDFPQEQREDAEAAAEMSKNIVDSLHSFLYQKGMEQKGMEGNGGIEQGKLHSFAHRVSNRDSDIVRSEAFDPEQFPGTARNRMQLAKLASGQVVHHQQAGGSKRKGPSLEVLLDPEDFPEGENDNALVGRRLVHRSAAHMRGVRGEAHRAEQVGRRVVYRGATTGTGAEESFSSAVFSDPGGFPEEGSGDSVQGTEEGSGGCLRGTAGIGSSMHESSPQRVASESDLNINTKGGAVVFHQYVLEELQGGEDFSAEDKDEEEVENIIRIKDFSNEDKDGAQDEDEDEDDVRMENVLQPVTEDPVRGWGVEGVGSAVPDIPQGWHFLQRIRGYVNGH